jgi:orotate phosphoribosyltransferase-like protein
MAAMLRRLLEDIKGGLLTTVENRAIAVTFDDFLDHGTEYLKRGRKDEAAVISGIVFEDTIRRICRVLGVAENGVPLDTLISELTKRDVLTEVKAKRARAAAGLRTSAAHARWEEIELTDVRPLLSSPGS